MALAFRHIETGIMAIVELAEGYGPPDWEAMPALPEGDGPWTWDGSAWLLDTAPAWAALRVERDARLRACDWTVLPDVPEPTRLAWLTYRQALRDLPETTIDPFAPEWPTPPA